MILAPRTGPAESAGLYKAAFPPSASEAASDLHIDLRQQRQATWKCRCVCVPSPSESDAGGMRVASVATEESDEDIVRR